MTVLGWLIANKHAHKEVCQHTLSEIKDALLEWKDISIIGWSKTSCWKANWVINQSAAWSITVLFHMIVNLWALYLGLFAMLQGNTAHALRLWSATVLCNFFPRIHLTDNSTLAQLGSDFKHFYIAFVNIVIAEIWEHSNNIASTKWRQETRAVKWSARL